MAISCGPGPQHPTISIVGFSLEAAQQLRQDALDDFTANTGIPVDLIPSWGDSAAQLARSKRLLSQHSSSPDIVLTDVVWVGALAPDLLDLAPHRDSASPAHLDELLSNDTVGGRLVALPLYLNVGVLYYRTDLLKKYGYPAPPATWGQLESMAARIQKGERAAGNAGFWGYVWQGGKYEGLTCNALEWQAGFGGGTIIDDSGAVTVNNPRAAQAIGMAARWIGAISPRSVLDYNEADSLNVFRSGNAAFLRHWSAGFPPASDKTSPIRGRFSIAPLPAGPNGRAQTMGGFHLAVSRYSAHPNEAARVVLFLTSPEIQLRRAERHGYLPTIPQLYRNSGLAHALPVVQYLRDAPAALWVARPSTAAGERYGDVSRAYFGAVHRVLAGEIPVGQALPALESQLAAITARR